MHVREYNGFFIAPEQQLVKNKMRCSVALRPIGNVNKLIEPFGNKYFNNVQEALEKSKLYIDSPNGRRILKKYVHSLKKSRKAIIMNHTPENTTSESVVPEKEVDSSSEVLDNNNSLPGKSSVVVTKAKKKVLSAKKTGAQALKKQRGRPRMKDYIVPKFKLCVSQEKLFNAIPNKRNGIAVSEIEVISKDLGYNKHVTRQIVAGLRRRNYLVRTKKKNFFVKGDGIKKGLD